MDLEYNEWWIHEFLGENAIFKMLKAQKKYPNYLKEDLNYHNYSNEDLDTLPFHNYII